MSSATSDFLYSPHFHLSMCLLLCWEYNRMMASNLYMQLASTCPPTEHAWHRERRSELLLWQDSSNQSHGGQQRGMEVVTSFPPSCRYSQLAATGRWGLAG